MVLLLPYWLVKGVREKKYLSNLRERLGLRVVEVRGAAGSGAGANAGPGGAIWIHAVSVGEVLSGVALARRLKQEYPDRALVISTTTITGHALAAERMDFANAVIYFPLDWAFAVRRVMDVVRPAVVIILETEIWPNFLREAAKRKVPVVFVGGRISDRSFARYEKYLRSFGSFLKPFLAGVLGNASAFLMQSEKDAERVRALGAPAQRVVVNGNLKYDQELPRTTPLAEWLETEARERGRSPIIVAGSIVSTEEPLALIAFGTLQGEYPRALLVLAPRKPERFGDAADFIHESRRKFIRRSELPVAGPQQAQNGNASLTISDDVTVLLLDSIGELASLYRIADGVLVGGSLVNSGGHNILEPAAFGKIPVFGPSMENFAEVAGRFVAAGAAVQVESPEDAGVAWIEHLREPARMREAGERARQLVETSRGATERAIVEIRRHLDGAQAAG